MNASEPSEAFFEVDMDNVELREKALSLLAREYGEHRASTRLSMIETSYAPALRDAFFEYVKTGQEPQYEYEGFTFSYVKQKTFSTTTGTFRYFDMLMNDEDFKKLFREIDFGRK